MGTMASKITSLTIVYSNVYSDADQRKHQSWNFNQNTKFFIHENASQNIIDEMAAILSRAY